MPVENNRPVLIPYATQQSVPSQPTNNEQIPEELFMSEAAQDLRRAYPDGLPDTFYQDQQSGTLEAREDYSFLEEDVRFQDFEFRHESNDSTFDPSAPPVLYDLHDPRNPINGGEDPAYKRYQSQNRRQAVDAVRSNLRTAIGERGATLVEASIGLAHIATGGSVKHSFDTSGFIPRSKLSISASFDGEARMRFKIPLGGGT